MRILPLKFPIRGGPLLSSAQAPDKCQGGCTIVHVLPLQEGGKYSELEQLFTFDMFSWFISSKFGFSPIFKFFQGRGNMSWLPCVMESLSDGGGVIHMCGSGD